MTTGTSPRIIDNRYILDETCREGGTARVYSSVDRRTHRTVAVKILARELNDDERLVNRVFDRERRSLERLRHLNIRCSGSGGAWHPAVCIAESTLRRRSTPNWARSALPSCGRPVCPGGCNSVSWPTWCIDDRRGMADTARVGEE